MYKCENLTYKKLSHLKKLNSDKNNFNSLNHDFFESFSKKNFVQKILLLRKIKLLKYYNDYVGYIWVEKQQRAQYNINSIYFLDEIHAAAGGTHLIKSLSSKSSFTYECENNNVNFIILEKLGFIKDHGTIELIKEIKVEENLLLGDGISFECFVRDKHEKLRCELQNSIFLNDNREPLTIEDIYFDIEQDYFLEEGSIFIKYRNEYIGYGQVILDDSIPTIVNFGILSSHRGIGYGKLLLNYLINLMYKMNFFQVKLRVNSENYPALNLYISTGFVKMKEYHRWNLII